jgi:hypothetical protein
VVSCGTRAMCDPDPFIQVTTAAGNYLAGNTLRKSQPDLMCFLSTHIGAGDFDPTRDVILQLRKLDQAQPRLLLDQVQLKSTISLFMQKARSRLGEAWKGQGWVSASPILDV